MSKGINKLKEAVQIPFSVSDFSYHLPDYMKTEQLHDLSQILLDELDYGFFIDARSELESEFEGLFNDVKSYKIYIPLIFESNTALIITVFDLKDNSGEVHRLFRIYKKNAFISSRTYAIPMEFIDVDHNLISIS